MTSIDSPTPTKQIQSFAWFCNSCQKECIPIRAESRCLCGHRFKEHQQDNGCQHKACNCRLFFYIVAEGSWILRCRCKHRHTDHDPNTHSCKKASCSCIKFDSPWVCNCDHPWSDHTQKFITKTVVDVEAIVKSEDPSTKASVNEIETDVGWEVNRWDLVKRGEKDE